MSSIKRSGTFDSLTNQEPTNSAKDAANSTKEDANSAKEGNFNKTYDRAFKQFFRWRSVLAVLLRNIVPEFEGMLPEEIMEYITASSVNNLYAKTLSEENVDSGSKILYDVVIECELPESKEGTSVNIIFDLEMQRNFQLKYNLVNRAIYYTCSLISQQKITNSNYDNINPVYSTWICLYKDKNATNLENTVHQIRLKDLGESSILPTKSILNIDMLLLSHEYDWDTKDKEIIKFLQAVFKNKMDNHDFNPYVEVTSDMREELRELKNIEDDIRQEIADEREDAIIETIIKTVSSLGFSDQEIVAQITKLTDCTQEEATAHLKSYREKK